MAGRPDSAVQDQAAFILFRRAKTDHQADWYREALLRLASTPTKQKGSFDKLDHCLARLVSDAPEIGTTFLENFVTSREYGGEDEDAGLLNVLGDTVAALRRTASDLLEGAITRWLESSDYRLHRAASDLLAHGHDGTPESEAPVLKLSKRVLDSLDESTVMLVVMRVLGYVDRGRPLAAAVASALQRELLTPELTSFVEDALSEHVLYNYPGSAGKYLKTLEIGEVPETAHKAIQRAMARSEEYFQGLSKLPSLKELRPPTHRMARLGVAQRKWQAAIMEQARKRSVLSLLAHHVPLKFGASFFTEIEGTFTEPTRLGSISHELELARGERVDPLGQQLQRLRWRSSGLDQAKREEPA